MSDKGRNYSQPIFRVYTLWILTVHSFIMDLLDRRKMHLGILWQCSILTLGVLDVMTKALALTLVLKGWNLCNWLTSGSVQQLSMPIYKI